MSEGLIIFLQKGLLLQFIMSKLWNVSLAYTIEENNLIELKNLCYIG